MIAPLDEQALRRIEETAEMQLFGALAEAPERYRVLGRLGAGGQGVVYRGYDAVLRRPVALKQVEAFAHASRARLLSEAMALARLSHPNVAGVFDFAETAAQGDFLVMELVDGSSLRAWLADQPRTWREVLDVFLQAGAGLAAAHAAGLVHRDIKPDNLVVPAGGPVRVIDFGVALFTGGDEGDPAPSPTSRMPTVPMKVLDPAQAEDATRDSQHSTIGRHAGTPTYMAPELRYQRGRASPASDIFSFCASLWEALHGKPPVPDPVRASVEPGPRDPKVPAWLSAVVARGLAWSPEARWPDVPSLLAALRRDALERRRRRWLLAGGGLALVGASVTATLLVGAGQPGVCTGAEARLAGIWDAPRKAEVAAALLAVDLPYAADTWARVEHVVDDWTHRLVTTHRETCEATRVRGERSEQMLDLSMICLDRRVDELSALLAVLARPDAQILQRAVTATYRLPNPESCADFARLSLPVQPPEDEATLAAVRAASQEMAHARALRLTGEYAGALAEATAIVGRARALGYRPALAEALELEADLLHDRGEIDAAIATGTEAALEAEASRHDEVSARVRAQLAHVLAVSAARPKEAIDMLRWAQAALDRLDGDAVLAAELAQSRVSVAQAASEWTASHGLALAALTRIEAAFGPRAPKTADALHNLGITEQTLGRPAEALPRHERSIEIWTEIFGPHHPEVAYGYSSHANALTMLGRHEEALAGHQRALEIWERALGPEHLLVAATLNNLAVCLLRLERLDESRATIERGVALWERTGPEHPKFAELLNTLGELSGREGDREAAIAAFARSSRIFRAVEGEGTPSAARGDVNQAIHLVALARWDEAIALLEPALATLEAAVGKDSPMLVPPLSALGDARSGRREYAVAAAHYARTLELLRSEDPLDSEEIADIAARLERVRGAR